MKCLASTKYLRLSNGETRIKQIWQKCFHTVKCKRFGKTHKVKYYLTSIKRSQYTFQLEHIGNWRQISQMFVYYFHIFCLVLSLFVSFSRLSDTKQTSNNRCNFGRRQIFLAEFMAISSYSYKWSPQLRDLKNSELNTIQLDTTHRPHFQPLYSAICLHSWILVTKCFFWIKFCLTIQFDTHFTENSMQKINGTVLITWPHSIYISLFAFFFHQR